MKRILSLSLALILFVIPLLVHIEGLPFAGHIALSIFLLAAVLWMFEPIPIYGTSVLVILLGILLLSGQGFVFAGLDLPATVFRLEPDGTAWLPAEAVSQSNNIFLVTGRQESSASSVEVMERKDRMVRVKGSNLKDGMPVVSDASHRLAGYKPSTYADFFNTLANSVIILFMGGLLMADAATKYNFDKTVARWILTPFGNRPSMIVLGLITVTATVSAFMSNTAATAMMMTVALPILARLPAGDKFKAAVVLAIPFGANIGGIATPVGTPPNAVALAGLVKQGVNVTFGTWVAMALPLAILMTLFAWWVLIKLFPPSMERFDVEFHGDLDKSPKAIVLYVVMGITVVLWVTEALHGISSSIVAFFTVVALVVTEVVDESDIQKLSWEVLWLVSGGIALDVIIRTTGLAAWFVHSISWTSLGTVGTVAAFGLAAVVMAEFLSHTICATILMPLAVSVGAVQSAGDPVQMILIALVVGIGVSFSMALPISTPPNAIATSTGLVDTKQMAKAGVIIGGVGLVVLMLFAKFYWPLILK